MTEAALHPCTYGQTLAFGYSGCTHGDMVERDRWDRPLVVPATIGNQPPKVPYTRASTPGHTISDGSADGLINWYLEMALRGITADPDLLAAATALIRLDGDHSREIRNLGRTLAEIGGSKTGADRGTENHEEIIGYLLTGEHSPFADQVARDSAEKVREELEKRNLAVVFGEQFVVDHPRKIGGTYDLLLHHLEEGTFHIGDVKTSAKLNDKRYPHPVSIQLAGYANGHRYCALKDDHPHDPPVSRRTGYLISVPLDTVDVYIDEVDLEVGLTGLDLALQGRAWLKEKPLVSERRAAMLDVSMPGVT